MADIQSNIRVNIDTSDALASIKALQSQISAFQKQLRASSSANAMQAENLQRSLIGDINATGKFAARIQTIKSSTESFTTALEKNKLSMGEYFKFGASQIGGFRNIFTSEFNTIEKVARERVKTLQTQYISLGRDANGALKAVSVRPLVLDMDNLATRQAIASQRQQIFNQLLRQGSTNLLNFGKNTQWAGRQLMVGFTIPLSIFGAQAARTFMELEEQAIRFRRVYGELFTPAEEADSMLQQLKDLGLEFAKYGVAVKDTLALAADAAAMGKTGVDLTAQVSEATRLAVLGSVSQQQALETTISLTSAFGTATEELANKINFLNAVENQTVVSIEDLTIAIPKAGPVVQQLGGDVEDLAFFLTAMKEGGINASEGANALKSGLASLINPTEKAAMMLKSYGINIRDIVESNRGDIKGVVVDFANALDQLDPLTRARAIEQLFGKFQFARISTLFQNVISEGSQAARVLELTNATTAELAQLSTKELARVEESTTFKFRAAIEEFQSALAPIGEEFLKLVTPLINFGTDVLKTFNNMSDGAKQFVTGVVAVLGGIAPVAIMTFGLLANGIANMLKGFAFVRTTILGFGRDTTTLGSQLEYMTNEQLQAASVAASLDQIHSKLIQTFTSEKAAVDQLASAYSRAVQASSRLIVSPIPTDLGRRTQGFASGGIIKGPGTGTSDSIVARVSNGEAIIPAASVRQNPDVVSALISGGIPGFAKGKNGEFAHIGQPVNVGAQTLLEQLRDIPDAISPRFLKMVEQAAQIFGNEASVKLYAKLGIRTGTTPDGTSINNLLDPRKGGVSQEDFLADWDKQGLARWKDSLKYAGIKLDDVASELTVLDDEMRQYIASLDRAEKITDDVVERAFNASARNIGAGNSAVAALTGLSGVAGEGRLNISQALADKYGLPMAEGGGSKGARQLGTMKVRLGGDRFPFYTKQGFDLATEAADGIQQGVVAGVRQSTRQASPAKEAIDAGKNIGIGAIDGIEGQIDEAKNAGAQLANAVASGTSQSRRASSGQTKFDEKSRQFVPTDKFNKQQLAREQAQIRLNNLAAASFSSMINKAQGASFALSSIAGIASMFGGTVGDVAGILFQLSSAMFGLITITELLSKTQLASLVVSRANTVAQTLGAASLSKLFVSGKGIAGLFTNLGKGLMFGLRFLGPVGIGLSAVAAALPFVINAFEEQRKKLEAFGNVINVTASQLKFLGDQAGVTVVESSPLESMALPTGADVAQAEVERVKQSEAFRKEFAQQIEALKTGTAESMELALQALAFKLLSSGLPQETVKATIVALMQEAARTDIQFQFNNIGISEQNLTTLIADVQSFLNDAFKNKAKFSITGQFSLQDSGELKQDAEAVGKAYGDMVDSIARQFNAARGEMQLDDFRAQFDAIEQALLSASDNAEIQAIVMKSALSSIKNVDLRNAVMEIKDYSDQLMILEMIASGVVKSEDIKEYIDALSADPLKEGNEVIKIRTKLQQRMNSAVESGTQAVLDNIAAEEQKTEMDLVNADYEEALGAIRQQTADILLQNQAYKLLVDSGWLASEALEAVADANFMAAYSNAANDPTKIKEIADAYRELVAATATSVVARGSGGGKKSPFQEAVEQLRNQRKEVTQSISAYYRLRKAGVDIRDAFAAAEDPTIATALATTKVGTKEWRTLVRLVNEFNAATARSKFLKVLEERKATIALTESFSQIMPLLSKLGLSADQIEEIFGDPDLAKAFVEDLKDGEINSKNVLDYINQIPDQKRVDILFNMATPEGMTAAFEEAFSRQNELFDLQERQIESEFRARLKAGQDAVDAAQAQVATAQAAIDSLQTKIASKQKEIELTIDRPIEELNKQLALIERSIELEYTRPIGDLQEESSDLANDLSLMDREVDAINEKYDNQEKTLERLSQLNSDMLEQDKQRLDIADAIGRGDIAAAARAIRLASQEESRRARERANQALQTAREREIANVRSRSGLTREQIEQRQFEISQQIFDLEEKREAKQAQIRDIQDRIYNIDQLRLPLLDSIRQFEDQIYTIQIGDLATAEGRLKTAEDELKVIEDQKQARLDEVEAQRVVWNNLQNDVDAARINADGYLTSLEKVRDMVKDIQNAWKNVNTIAPDTISNITTPPPTGNTGSTGGTGTGSGGGKKVNPNWTAANDRVKTIQKQYDDAQNKLAAFIKERDSINKTIKSSPSSYKLNRLDELAKLISSWSSTATWTGKALKDARDTLAKTPQYLAYGGMVKKMKSFNVGGMARGTDIVPAMLTPGEFVIRKSAVTNFGVDKLEAINSGSYGSDSVYNYSINVNVKSDANPNEIARAVMTQIKQIDAQKIKGNRF